MQTLIPATCCDAIAGERLSFDDGMRLYQEADAAELIAAADARAPAQASRGRGHVSGGSQHQLHQRLHHRLRLLRLLSQARQRRGATC